MGGIRPAWVRPASLIAAAALIAACSSGQDAEIGERRPRPPATEDSVGSPTSDDAPTTEPPTTAETTDETAPAPPPADLPATAVAPLTDGNTSATASALLPPTNGRGFLLAGSVQDHPGARWSATMWESDDGLDWMEGDQPALGAGVDSDATSAVWAGSALVVGGSVISEDGTTRPAVWIAPDGATLAEPEDPFGQPGSVSAIAASDKGPVAVGVSAASGPLLPTASVRDAAGDWRPVPLPGTAAITEVLGVAVSGSRVVVTGAAHPSGVGDAVAWVSNDGGVTFVSADTTDVTGADEGIVNTALGSVSTWPSGFVAAACVMGPEGLTTALATSADGSLWERIDINATFDDGSEFPNAAGECTSLTVDGERLLLGAFDLGAVVLDLDASGEGGVWEAPRGSHQRSVDVPLTAVGPDGIVAVSRESRGLTAGIEDDQGVIGGDDAGLPDGSPAPTQLTLAAMSGELLAKADVYPVVSESFDGSIGWSTETRWASTADGAAWGDAALPADAADVISAGTIDLAWGPVRTDPADAHADGPTGATEAWERSPGDEWHSVGLLVGGPGGESIDDIVAVEGGFVGVGSSSFRDPDSGQYAGAPLATASDDGLTWTAEEPPAVDGDAGLSRACPLPGGSVLALGGALVDGAIQPYVTLRSPDGAWSAVDVAAMAPDDVVHDNCARGPTDTLLVATANGHPVVARTSDGATFAATSLDGPEFAGAFLTSVVHTGSVWVAAGMEPALGSYEPAVWTSTDGATWTESEITVGGPGEQYVDDVVVHADQLFFSGIDRGAPSVWSFPLP